MSLIEILLSIPFIILCVWILFKAIETAKNSGYNDSYKNRNK
ncbi:hypothetical protein B0I03_10557 [Flavobacterium aquaticum]|uniref:Uncharacterized protein n=1 Tax=Flavobacterium aquaticum TaxID=1236486 RepID=A0A327YPN5_9FLAO|nr:hypothetical protein B0I03_10557 [Flavobacterium aquaticum]